MKRKAVGELGEKIAKEYLQKKGYQIIETNYRCREGEIDIIARDKDYLTFVEVRTRKGTFFGSPEESITTAKKEKLTSLAFIYLQTHRKSPSLWRFDVVAVELNQEEQVSRIELIQNAIG
jgi:putative endonuclease